MIVCCDKNRDMLMVSGVHGGCSDCAIEALGNDGSKEEDAKVLGCDEEP